MDYLKNLKNFLRPTKLKFAIFIMIILFLVLCPFLPHTMNYYQKDFEILYIDCEKGNLSVIVSSIGKPINCDNDFILVEVDETFLDIGHPNRNSCIVTNQNSDKLIDGYDTGIANGTVNVSVGTKSFVINHEVRCK